MGVPRAGAMDLQSLDTLNAMLGNDPACAAVECALSAGEFEFRASATFAVGGARGSLKLRGNDISHFQTQHASQGDKLEVGAPETWRFTYIAIGGGIALPTVMGSRSTYLPGQLGGLDGQRLKPGDEISVGRPPRRLRHQVSDSLPDVLRPRHDDIRIRFVPRGGVELAPEWKVSAASDRTGYRLEGGYPVSGASITSEPVCPGVIQVTPAGEAIVLMTDAPTVGGYLIARAVISADLGRLAQKIPGSVISFEAVTVEEAQRAAGQDGERLENVREWSLA